MLNVFKEAIYRSPMKDAEFNRAQNHLVRVKALLTDAFDELTANDKPSRILDIIQDEPLRDAMGDTFLEVLSEGLEDGSSVLEWAIRKGYIDHALEMIELLKCQGKDQGPGYLGTVNTSGSTPLIVAIAFGRYDIVKRLIDVTNENDLDITTKDGATALALILSTSDDKRMAALAPLLIARMTPEQLERRISNHDTYLMHAIMQKSYPEALAIVSKLKPEALAARSEKGYTALVLATGRSHSVFTALLEKMPQAQLGLRDLEGNTALLDAIKLNQAGYAETLIPHMTHQQRGLHNNKGEDAQGMLYVKTGSLWLNARAMLIQAQQAVVPERGAEATVKSTRELLQAAIESGDMDKAMQVGNALADACAEFTKSVRQAAQDSLVSAASAVAEMDRLSAGAERFETALRALTGPERAPEASLWQKAWNAVRGQATDPAATLEQGRDRILDSMRDALGKSAETMRSFQGFQKRFPDIKTSIEEMRRNIGESFETLDHMTATGDEAQSRSALRMRRYLQSKEAIAERELSQIEFLMDSTDDILDTETSLVIRMEELRSAVTASEINAIYVLSLLKEQATERMQEKIQPFLSAQFQIAAELKQLAENRGRELVGYAAPPAPQSPALNLTPVK